VLAAVAALFAISALTPAPSLALVSAAIVECGQVVAYTAPDPVTPADGSLTIGLLPPWDIAADATVSAAAAAVLPSMAGSGPSCLTLNLDSGGVVTTLDFASEGSVTGLVIEDAGIGGYVFASRLYVPTFITDAYPGLAAVFVTSAATGTDASATFTVDTTSGQFTGFDATASFCGPGNVDGDGNGLVGNAVISATVLDAADVSALTSASGEDVCADVQSIGTIGNEIVLTTSVTISPVEVPDPTALPDPPNTATATASNGSSQPEWPVTLLAIFALATLVLAASIERRPSRSR
jgi:hypothetical protein